MCACLRRKFGLPLCLGSVGSQALGMRQRLLPSIQNKQLLEPPKDKGLSQGI